MEGKEKMFKKIILTVALMVAFTTTANAANMWGEYGANPQNTGQSKFTGPETAEDTVKVPLAYGNVDTFVSPVIDGAGNVYYLDESREKRERVINPDTGYWEWVVVQDAGSELVKYDWEGNILWKKPMPIYKCRDNYGTTSLALANKSNKIFVACSGRTELWSDPLNEKLIIHAINTDTSDTVWQKSMERYSVASIGAITVDSNDNIYFIAGFNDTGIWSENKHAAVSVDTDGNTRWESELGLGRGYDIVGPILTNDESSLITYRYARYNEKLADGTYLYHDAAHFESISTADGTVNWRKEIEEGGTGWQQQTSFALDANDTIWALSYFKDEPGETCRGYSTGLFGVDSSNGETISYIPVVIDIDCGPHVAVGPSGTVYITYDDADVYQINPDTGRWERVTLRKGGIAAIDPVNGEKWVFELPDSAEANATPAIDAQENIYFSASFGQILYKLDKDGNVVWEYNIDPNAEPCNWYNGSWYHLNSTCYAVDHFNYGAMPVIGRGGSVYIASEKNMHIIKNNITEEAVIASIEELVTSGDLNTGNASAIISSIENAIDANTDNAHDNMLDATINKIEALVASKRMDADSAQSMIDTLNLLK